MLYELGRELDAYLQDRGVPFRVVHGPGDGATEARPITGFARGRVVLERNRQGGDTFGGPRSVVQRGVGASEIKAAGSQTFSAIARVIVASTVLGAQQHEHEELADTVVRHVVLGLRDVLSRRKHAPNPPSRGHFLSAQELQMAGLEQWPGVVYELEFSIERGLFDSSWEGVGQPLGSIDHVVHTGCAGD